MSDHEHTWVLTETGYTRSWQIDIDEASETVVAYFGGTEDFSDQGAGDDHLECSTCLETKPLPEGWEIDYQ